MTGAESYDIIQTVEATRKGNMCCLLSLNTFWRLKCRTQNLRKSVQSEGGKVEVTERKCQNRSGASVTKKES